jgi:hypothetical protein
MYGAEAAANFAALGGMASDLDGQAFAAVNPGAAAEAAAVESGPDYVTEARGTVEFLGAMLDGYAPGAGFKPEQVTAMSHAVAPVMEKYGFTLGAMPCELVALMVCGPVLYTSAKVVALKIQTDKLEAARVARGLTDPNTVRGARDAVPPSASQAPDSANQREALERALVDANVFPVM